MKEKTVENYLVWKVELMGGQAFKFTSPANRGVADRVVCLPDGSTWFIELKSPTGRRSELQKMFGATMGLLKQNYAVLGSIEEVDNWSVYVDARTSA